jgi:hypothetical protein
MVTAVAQKMTSSLENKLSRTFESAFSQAMPDFVQILDKHGISQTLEVSVMSNLFDPTKAMMLCCFVVGKLRCPCSFSEVAVTESTLKLDDETAESLSRDMEKQLMAIAPQVLPLLKEADELFEIVLRIDPAKAERPLSGRFVAGVLTCS